MGRSHASAPPASPAAAAAAPRQQARPARRLPGWAWLAPAAFFAYAAVFFLVPVGAILVEAFRGDDPTTGDPVWTGANVAAVLRDAYGASLLNSVELSLVTAVLGTVCGLVLAWAISATGSSALGQLVSSAAAVLANFGGLPLAFLFVAAIGNAGVLTGWLAGAGLPLPKNFLYSLPGVAVVYLYFLVPLMVLVITPALEGLKPQWREASDNLGGTVAQYWLHVAGPVLAPSLVGSLALLFCSSFSAYATAAALTNGTLAITPLAIASAVSGNVLVGQENVGYALALAMVVVVVPLTLLYQWTARRTARWLS
ncbi:ABC transporter permease [Quadrisphaera oryzae]|uniref:ABC transporter permease n=1 Tax=Quadrisphaera oryzae TaxID=2509661 RepID=UPI0016447A03|nr:ABC transporter permease [Quadrisphaera sp. RL12-1S]